MQEAANFYSIIDLYMLASLYKCENAFSACLYIYVMQLLFSCHVIFLQADGLNAISRVGVPADHRGIVCDRHVFRILKQWLKAGEPDPFYDPVNDYVILPTAFEIERHRGEKKDITSVKEEWEIVSSEKNDKNNYTDKSTGIPPFIGSVSVTCEGENKSSEEAEAMLVVEPKINGKQHVELRARGVTMDK